MNYKYHHFLPITLGSLVGKGHNGEVYAVVGNPYLVVKVAEISDLPNRTKQQECQRIVEVLRYVLLARPLPYVCLHRYGLVQVDEHISLIYYEMDRLSEITEDEGKVFHSILSHEDRQIEKNYPLLKIEQMLQGMSLGLDFDPKKVILFCRQLKEAPLAHLDIAPRNIMKNSVGEFRLIDPESVLLSCQEN